MRKFCYKHLPIFFVSYGLYILPLKTEHTTNSSKSKHLMYILGQTERQTDRQVMHLSIRLIVLGKGKRTPKQKLKKFQIIFPHFRSCWPQYTILIIFKNRGSIPFF